MEPMIYKPGAYNTPGVYKGAGGIYNGRGVYNDGADSGDITEVEIGGRIYPVVKINNKYYLAQNLDFRFDGLTIGSTASNFKSPGGWYYNNNEATYGYNGPYQAGMMYNFYAIEYIEQNNLIPGWHIWSRNECLELYNYLGGNTDAIKAMKSLDNFVNNNWPTSWNGNGESGLNITPCGWRRDRATFEDFGTWANYMFTDSSSETIAQALYFGQDNVPHFTGYQKVSGNYVRLVKD